MQDVMFDFAEELPCRDTCQWSTADDSYRIRPPRNARARKQKRRAVLSDCISRLRLPLIDSNSLKRQERIDGDKPQRLDKCQASEHLELPTDPIDQATTRALRRHESDNELNGKLVYESRTQEPKLSKLSSWSPLSAFAPRFLCASSRVRTCQRNSHSAAQSKKQCGTKIVSSFEVPTAASTTLHLADSKEVAAIRKDARTNEFKLRQEAQRQVYHHRPDPIPITRMPCAVSRCSSIESDYVPPGYEESEVLDKSYTQMSSSNSSPASSQDESSHFDSIPDQKHGDAAVYRSRTSSGTDSVFRQDMASSTVSPAHCVAENPSAVESMPIYGLKAELSTSVNQDHCDTLAQYQSNPKDRADNTTLKKNLGIRPTHYKLIPDLKSSQIARRKSSISLLHKRFSFDQCSMRSAPKMGEPARRSQLQAAGQKSQPVLASSRSIGASQRMFHQDHHKMNSPPRGLSLTCLSGINFTIDCKSKPEKRESNTALARRNTFVEVRTAW